MFKPHNFRVIRKSCTLTLFLQKSINTELRDSEYISFYRPSPTSTSSNYFAIYLFINLAVSPTAPYRLSLSLCCMSAILSVDLSVCQHNPSSAASLFLSIYLNPSLRGTQGQSNQSHHLVHVPLATHRSPLLSLPPCTPLAV